MADTSAKLEIVISGKTPPPSQQQAQPPQAIQAGPPPVQPIARPEPPPPSQDIAEQVNRVLDRALTLTRPEPPKITQNIAQTVQQNVEAPNVTVPPIPAPEVPAPVVPPIAAPEVPAPVVQVPKAEPTPPPKTQPVPPALLAKFADDKARIDQMNREAAERRAQQPAPVPPPVAQPAPLPDAAQTVKPLNDALREWVDEVIKVMQPPTVAPAQRAAEEWAQEVERYHRATLEGQKERAAREKAYQEELARIQEQALRDIAAGRTPKAQPIPEAKAADPTVRRVMERMESEKKQKEESRKEHQVRMDLDPEYKKGVESAQRKEIFDVVGMVLGRNNVGFQLAQMRASNMVAGGAGKAAGAAGGAAAAAGPLMAGIMGAEMVAKAFAGLTTEVGKFGKAIMAVDADGFAQEVSNLAKKIPIVGELFGAVGDAILGVLQATDQRAQQLARFSPELAQAQAQAQVNRIMRQIRHAQEQGPALADYVLKREEQKARLEDMLARLGEKLLPLVTRIVEMMTGAAEFAEPWAVALLETTRTTAVVLGHLVTADTVGAMNAIVAMTERIAANTTPPAQVATSFWDRLTDMPAGFAHEGPAVPGVIAPAPPAAMPALP